MLTQLLHALSSPRARRVVLPAVLAVLLLGLLYSSSSSTYYERVREHVPISWKPPSWTSPAETNGLRGDWPIRLDPSCANLPGANETLVVMKTGSSVVEERLPIHFTTTFRCTPDFIVFSDMKQTVQGVPIYDSLDELHNYVDMSNKDLQYYEFLKETGSARQRGWWNKVKDYGQESSAAWEMDKYKNIPILRKSYAMYPDKKWFIFIDADTSIMWANILNWLGQMNSSEPFYTGSQNWIGDVEFAHGGSGYIISQAAAKILAEEDDTKAKEHISFAEHECCGDMVLSHALHDHQIALNGSWPNIQGGDPHKLDFDIDKWCYGAMTFHHTTPQQTEDLWKLERKYDNTDHPHLTYADVFTDYIEPLLRHRKDEWDNGSEEILYPPNRSWEDQENDPEGTWKPNAQEEKFVSSYDGCRYACQVDKGCFQWLYKANATSEGQPSDWPGVCGLRKRISLGVKRETPAGEVGWSSGWDLERIETWVRKHKCEGEPLLHTWWDKNGHLEPPW